MKQRTNLILKVEKGEYNFIMLDRELNVIYTKVLCNDIIKSLLDNLVTTKTKFNIEMTVTTEETTN